MVLFYYKKIFFRPFKLAPAKEAYFDKNKVTKPFTAKGEWGNRGEKINELILNMI